MTAEIKGNWLGTAFDECRKIGGLPRRERKREIACLVAKITGHNEGGKFPAGSELERVIQVGLNAAEAAEDSLPGGGKPSPGRAGALTLCDACNPKVNYSELADD